MAHSISGKLLAHVENFSYDAPNPRCEHLKKTKEQTWSALGSDVLMCRDCAVEKLGTCCLCSNPASMYFITSYLRGSTGNDPNYFIAPGCAQCCTDVPEGEWGVKLIEFKAKDGRIIFMNLKQVTSSSIPEVAIDKKTEETKDELEVA